MARWEHKAGRSEPGFEKAPDRPSDSMVGPTRMRTALSRFVLSATRPFQLSAAQKKVHVSRYPFASPRPLCRYSFPLKDFGKLHHLSCSYSPLTKARCTQAPATTVLLFVHAKPIPEIANHFAS